MIFQFVDEKQSNYCVINSLNLAVDGGIRLVLFVACHFGNIRTGMVWRGLRLSAYLICHCNPMSVS